MRSLAKIVRCASRPMMRPFYEPRRPSTASWGCCPCSCTCSCHASGGLGGEFAGPGPGAYDTPSYWSSRTCCEWQAPENPLRRSAPAWGFSMASRTMPCGEWTPGPATYLGPREWPKAKKLDGRHFSLSPCRSRPWRFGAACRSPHGPRFFNVAPGLGGGVAGNKCANAVRRTSSWSGVCRPRRGSECCARGHNVRGGREDARMATAAAAVRACSCHDEDLSRHPWSFVPPARESFSRRRT